MSELVQKLSNYNIFNYLFPGIIVCYFLEMLDVYQIFNREIIVSGFVCYFIGLCISRISSLIIEPILIKTKLLPRRCYDKYVEASKLDDKIELFSEISNSYRTLMIAFIIIPVAKVFKVCPNDWKSEDWKILVFCIFLSLLFLFAHRKQNSFVIKRIDYALKQFTKEKQ